MDMCRAGSLWHIPVLIACIGMTFLTSWKQRNNTIRKNGSFPVGVDAFGFELEGYGVLI